MSAENAWMPLYIGDYIADTMHLTALEHGAYLLLIMHYWRNGPLPDNDKFLHAIARCKREQWDEDVSQTVRSFFSLGEDGLLHHKRIDEEISKARRVSSKRRDAAHARWNKSDANDDANALHKSSKRDDTRARLQSQSQVQIPSSLRSDGVVGVNGHGGLFPEPKPPDPEPVDPKKRVYQDGRAILQRLGVKSDPGALITQWLTSLHGDADGLLEVLYAAEREKPVGAVAWIKAGVKSRGGGVPRDDPWGIRAWLRRQPDTKSGKHAQTGADVICINGFPVEEMAMEIAEAASLPNSWRGNWDAFGVWMREELVSTSAAIDAIRSQARRMTEPVHSIAVFDRAVRGAP